MPDIIDQIQQRETIGQNQRLEQAVHAADWTSAFSQPQSTESLRAQRNVTDLVAQAMERKAQLAAQTDLNAAKIYETNAKTKEFVEQAPLRDELLRGRIAAQGASTKYKAQQDALTLKDTSDFYNGVNAIQATIGSREHATAYIENLAAHPMAASTAGVREDIKLHTQVHDTAAALSKAVADYKAVTGFAPESIETTATGGVNLRGKTSGIGEATVKNYNLTPAQFKSAISVARVSPNPKTEDRTKEPYIGDKTGTTVQVTFLGNDGTIKNAFIPKDDYLRFGGKLAAEEDPKIALAKKALSDPNASEVHKAAAHKILGDGE